MTIAHKVKTNRINIIYNIRQRQSSIEYKVIWQSLLTYLKFNFIYVSTFTMNIKMKHFVSMKIQNPVTIRLIMSRSLHDACPRSSKPHM